MSEIVQFDELAEGDWVINVVGQAVRLTQLVIHSRYRYWRGTLLLSQSESQPGGAVDSTGYPLSEYPGCYYEWHIGPTELLQAAETHEQVMVACDHD